MACSHYGAAQGEGLLTVVEKVGHGAFQHILLPEAVAQADGHGQGKPAGPGGDAVTLTAVATPSSTSQARASSA